MKYKLQITVFILFYPTVLFAAEVGVSLKPCPNKPNCVSSLSSGKYEQVGPLLISGDIEEQWARLKSLVLQMPRTRLESDTENRVHFTCRSALFRFVDDLEFLLDRENRVIHLRSASRVGYSDLGANQKRIDAIRQRGIAAQP